MRTGGRTSRICYSGASGRSSTRFLSVDAERPGPARFTAHRAQAAPGGDHARRKRSRAVSRQHRGSRTRFVPRGVRAGSRGYRGEMGAGRPASSERSSCWRSSPAQGRGSCCRCAGSSFRRLPDVLGDQERQATACLPVSEPIEAVLSALPRVHPWVFTNAQTEQPYTVNGLRHVLPGCESGRDSRGGCHDAHPAAYRIEPDDCEGVRR